MSQCCYVTIPTHWQGWSRTPILRSWRGAQSICERDSAMEQQPEAVPSPETRWRHGTGRPAGKGPWGRLQGKGLTQDRSDPGVGVEGIPHPPPTMGRGCWGRSLAVGRRAHSHLPHLCSSRPLCPCMHTRAHVHTVITHTLMPFTLFISAPCFFH